MTMTIREQYLTLPTNFHRTDQLLHMQTEIRKQVGKQDIPIRLAVTKQSHQRTECELGVIAGVTDRATPPLLEFTKRRTENTGRFNTVLVIPTGIGAEIGGHAGDATPVAQLLATASDTLITHPNVVNASDIIDMPKNCLYVEGSALARLLQGTVGLEPTRNNRVLVLIGPHDDSKFIHGAINAVNAATITYAMRDPIIVRMNDGPFMEAQYSPSGRASGTVQGLEAVLNTAEHFAGRYDAVAITSQIKTPPEYYLQYFNTNGHMVNPWGGVEAILTHAITALHNVPSAHAPMVENMEIITEDPGIVDPRMAAEAVSFTLIQCVLKGLQHSPKIVTEPELMNTAHVMTAEDISCLVIPDQCVGIPTLAAMEQGITTIAVRENKNLMENDLTLLPWAEGQLHIVNNYWEAAGLINALRNGLDPGAVRRPPKVATVYPQP